LSTNLLLASHYMEDSFDPYSGRISNRKEAINNSIIDVDLTPD